MTFKSRSALDSIERLFRLFSLVLLPALGTEASTSINRPHQLANNSQTGNYDQAPEPVSRPYLTVASSPPLRVKAPLPPPAYDVEASPPGNSALDENALPPPPPVAQERMEAVPGTTPRVPTRQEQQRRKQEEEIPAILPDDLRKEVRPEDVIPFFLFPKNGAQVGVSVQMPAQPPAPTQVPSSATYRQE